MKVKGYAFWDLYSFLPACIPRTPAVPFLIAPSLILPLLAMRKALLFLSFYPMSYNKPLKITGRLCLQVFYYCCYYYFDFILKRFVIANIVIFCSYFNLLIIIVLSLSLNEYICAVFRRHMYRKLDFNLIFLSHFISHISQHTSVI